MIRRIINCDTLALKFTKLSKHYKRKTKTFNLNENKM